MKVNVFKIENDKVDDLTVELEDNGFECEADNEDENGYTGFVFKEKALWEQGLVRVLSATVTRWWSAIL